jgi:hypothetical protein
MTFCFVEGFFLPKSDPKKPPSSGTLYRSAMEPEPSRAMPVWVPSRRGSIRIVATTRTLFPDG